MQKFSHLGRIFAGYLLSVLPSFFAMLWTNWYTADLRIEHIPYHLFIIALFSIPLFITIFVAEICRFRQLAIYLIQAFTAGLLVDLLEWSISQSEGRGVSNRWLVGGFSSAFVMCAVAGIIYWFIAGRYAGAWREN